MSETVSLMSIRMRYRHCSVAEALASAPRYAGDQSSSAEQIADIVQCRKVYRKMLA